MSMFGISLKLNKSSFFVHGGTIFLGASRKQIKARRQIVIFLFSFLFGTELALIINKFRLGKIFCTVFGCPVDIREMP